MNSELQEKLYKKYPKIFKQKELDTTISLMSFGGICCDDGWYNIIDKLCESIQIHIDNGKYQRPYFYVIWWNEYIHRYINNGLYKLSRFIAGENREISFKVYTQEQWKERVESRPKISNWLENLTKKLPHCNYYRKPLSIKQVEVFQIKEKFATLRFYTNYEDDYVHGVIRMAESMSACTCENCGKPGKLCNKNYWLKTLCTSCARKFKFKDNKK